MKNKSSAPKTVSQWAADAYKALEKALIAFDEDYPDARQADRLELVGYAAELAAQARGITDPNRIDAADNYAVDHVLADIDADRDASEPEQLQYCVLFLLCYLDVHVSFGLLDEQKLEAIMHNLLQNYELVVE